MLNAEKVLKPPQKPTASKDFQRESALSFPASAAPIRMPINRELMVFAANVDQGTELVDGLPIHMPKP